MKEIRGFPNYLATDSGEIIGKKGIDNPEVKVEGEGYNRVYLLDELGNKVSPWKYRLICLAYHSIPDGKTEEELVVNHIDGVKTNDNPSNLQWVSESENILHGTLLGWRSKRPLIKCLKDNCEEHVLFNDLHDAVSSTGLSYEDVWESIRLNKKIGGYSFFHIPWNDKDVLQGRLVLGGDRKTFKRPIDVLDIDSGLIKEYSSMKEFADELGILITHVRIRISDSSKPKLLQKKYVVVDKGYGFDWLSERVKLELKSRGAKKLLAYNTKTNQLIIWDSVYRFIKDNGLSKAVVTKPIAKGLVGKCGDWVFQYLSDKAKENILNAAR